MIYLQITQIICVLKINYQMQYRVEKRNLQVAKLVNFEHVNENMAQNSSPACKHNLFGLIQSKKLLV